MSQAASSTSIARSDNGAGERVRQTRAPTAIPPVDVYESNDELLLFADIPGAQSDSIRVDLEKGQLTIEARRGDEVKAAALAMEGRTCDYFRAFSVPPEIDPSKVEAHLENGVLRLRLPKSDAVKPRRITVRAA